MQDISINIIGAGAIGHLWFSFLAKHGINATLYARKKVKQINLQVESPEGNFATKVNYHSIQEWQDADFSLICVKAHQLEQLCQQLTSSLEPSNRLKPSNKIVLMMNGMGLTEIVNRYFPSNPCLHAYLVHGAYMDNQRLLHTGNGATSLGNLHGTYAKEEFSPLISSLDNALSPVTWNDHHYQDMLLKLFINSVINPVTALLDIKNGDIVKNNQLISKCEQLLLELSPLLALLKFELSTAQLQEKIIEVALNTKDNSSSMRQDVLLGRKTEIDFINGYLLKVAKQAQIAIPSHSTIINQIKELHS